MRLPSTDRTQYVYEYEEEGNQEEYKNRGYIIAILITVT